MPKFEFGLSIPLRIVWTLSRDSLVQEPKRNHINKTMSKLYALLVGTAVNLTSMAIAQTEFTPEDIARQQREADEAAAAGCALCGGSIVFMVVVFVALIALNIALLIWVARDAKNRSMDSSVLWMFLVMFTGPIGLIIYIFSRPQGQLTQCASCNGKRLSASAKCPHCQNP
jgi:hypothetical protein